MRMDVAEAGLLRPPLEHLAQPRVRHASLPAEPEPRFLRMVMPSTRAEVAVEVPSHSIAEGSGSWPTPLAHDESDTDVQVQVFHPQVHELGRSNAGVDQESDHRRVPALLVATPLAGLSNSRNSSSLSTGTGVSGTVGGFMRVIGESVISPSSTAHLKSCASAR